MVSKDDSGSYTEPFVVIEGSESPDFTDYERLTFPEADVKFKEVEAAERALREADGKTGGYHKTYGVIFYKADPEDAELSTYSFRYDIGDYGAEQSGLLNHTTNFWNNAHLAIRQGDTNVLTMYTQEDVDGAMHMIDILKGVEQPPTLETPTITKSEVPQESRYQGTPLWQDYQFIQDQHPDRVLFYRLGDFYEVFASAVSEALNIALTSCDVGFAERVPMAGVPRHTFEDYAKRLTGADFYLERVPTSIFQQNLL